MDEFKKFCRLCGDGITDDYFKVIDDDVKDNLSGLLLKLNFTADKQHVMCGICTEKLYAASNFKSICLHIDNIIFPYVQFEESVPVDLKEVYVREKRSSEAPDIPDDNPICRLCLQPVGVENISLQNIPVKAIQIYIPEMNFNMTTDPVICLSCNDSLLTYSTFIKNCLHIDETLKKDTSTVTAKGVKIKFEEIDIKVEQEEKGEAPIEPHYNIKLEDIKQEIDDSHILTSDDPADLDIKDPLELRMFKCDRCEYESKHKNNLIRHEIKHMDPSEVQMYKCVECTFETKHRRSFVRHQLSHKKPSETRMYKCDKCQYETKYRNNFNTHQLTHKDPSQVHMYKCDKCQFESKHRKSFATHQLIHKDPSELKMYKCNKCQFETKYKSRLKLHEAIHNPPHERMHKCHICQCEFKNRKRLMDHQKRHESAVAEPIFKCDKCDYEGTQKRYLKSHYLQHKEPAEIRTYKCDKCSFETRYRFSLTIHKSSHLKSTEVRMYKCDSCSFETRHKCSFKRHQTVTKCSKQSSGANNVSYELADFNV